MRRGFTTIELLVVIAIIAILVALVMPAVQQARESARRTQCRHNLKELSLAMQNHLSTHGRFPSNGWGFLWIGDPDRGTDRRQPGGWIHSILPFLEQQTLREQGTGKPPAEKRVSLGELTRMPLPIVNCPSRPDGTTGPCNPILIWRNAEWHETVAKTDYAVNEGDYITDTGEGPETLQEGDSPRYRWLDVTGATGICFQRSDIRPADIKDGMSNVYMLGEKYVSTLHYNTADDYGHDGSLYSGVDLDINRWVIDPPAQDSEPIQERRFGSAHASSCHFAFCDGSVKPINYVIDYRVHLRLGNRKDGEVVDIP